MIEHHQVRLAPDARLLVAAEGRMRRIEVVAVGPHPPGLDRAAGAIGAVDVARALGLDFVPLFDERYDLVIAAQFYESDLLAPLLALIREPESAFRQAVAALGGYDLTPMGTVLAVI